MNFQTFRVHMWFVRTAHATMKNTIVVVRATVPLLLNNGLLKGKNFGKLIVRVI